MSNFESLVAQILQIKNLEQCGYAMGYINSEYAHNFITSKQYNILFDLIQTKRERLI